MPRIGTQASRRLKRIVGRRMKSDLNSPWRIGVDIGGTFTDLVLADPRGGVHVFKVPTVPEDPAQGAFDAVTAAAAGVGCSVPELLRHTALFVHGSTIATVSQVSARLPRWRTCARA